MTLFEQPLHEEFAGWATGFVTSGGADLGEIVAIAGRMPPGGNDGDFYAVWAAAADRHIAAAEDAETAGHVATARGHLMRAACYYGVAIHPLYGTPVDPRLVHGFDRIMASFERAMRLGDPPGEPLPLTFDGHDMPAWFIAAAGSRPGEVRPLVICVSGYDSTMADTYLGMCPATLERGYHCIVFDGPGQGAMLVREGVAMIPDWERAVSVVVDAALERPDVDPARIALRGWSLGGHLAARAATGERRLAACIADPPIWDMLDLGRGLVTHLGCPDAAATLPGVSDDDAATMTAAIEADRALRWNIIQRGFWVNGATDLQSFFAAFTRFTLDGRPEIRCPVLATKAEGDPNALGADAFVARLTCPATLIPFSAAEGAGGHCEMQDLWLLNARVLDWLDDTFSSTPATRPAVTTATGT